MSIEPDIYSEDPVPVAELIREREPKQGFRGILRTFSPSERLLLYTLILTLFLSGLVLLAAFNTKVSTEVPTQGGSLIEGAVGTPRFVNPLLAVSQVDNDMTALVYSGLVRADGNGGFIPDIAETYEISEDGTVYTFHLRQGLTFHDGSPLSADDVLFTVAMAQHPDVKSPRRADWEGVRAEAPDPQTVIFTLPHAYAPFLENARMGILPKKLWESVPSEEFPFSSLNTHPIGSGPYRVNDMHLDETGAPDSYELRAFKDFALGTPHIRKITYRTFANIENLIAAYEDGSIDSFVADSPKSLARSITESGEMQTVPLARVFGVFFNQNHAAILAKAEVRAALDAAIDKDAVIQEVLGGFGTALDGPIPPGLLTTAQSTSTRPQGTEVARDILTRNGWKFSTASTSEGVWTKGTETLTMTLATADTEELAATAEAVAASWRAAGIPTTVQVYPLTEFNQTILRPRSFDAILFGEVVGRSLDLFAFWHSSQRNDPGLNLALYTSSDADRLLASSRASIDSQKRAEFLREFLETLAADRPAVFLYSPSLAYVVPERIKGIKLETLALPSDRFASVYAWYRDTERVWNVFNK